MLYEEIINFISPMRVKYNDLKNNPKKVKDILKIGRDKMRPIINSKMEQIRNKIGFNI